jgi:hypothetical protein
MCLAVWQDFTLEFFDVVQNRIAVIIGQRPMVFLVRKPDESFRHAHEFSYFRPQIGKRGKCGLGHREPPFSQVQAVGRPRPGRKHS